MIAMRPLREDWYMQRWWTRSRKPVSPCVDYFLLITSRYVEKPFYNNWVISRSLICRELEMSSWWRDLFFSFLKWQCTLYEVLIEETASARTADFDCNNSNAYFAQICENWSQIQAIIVISFSLQQRLKQKNPNARFTCTVVEDVVEHGVMFHRIPDNATEQKKSPSIFKYWVIGYV